MIDQASLLHIVQRECHVRIDLDRYARNIGILKSLAGPECELMAVVKANAYGHGAVECARIALLNGATYLAVARVWEGITLRASGIEAPVLVLGGPNPDALDLAAEHDLAVTVGTEAAAEAVKRAAPNASKPLRVHVKLDTGLHRYGAAPELTLSLVANLSKARGIVLEGIYAHFSSADEQDSGPTMNQIAVAESVIEKLETAGNTFRYIHLPNSAATITGLTGRSNMVRAGIATYGLAPSPDVELPDGVRPVMSVHGRLTRVHNLPAGEGVSYGLTYRAERNELVGTVPIGYADGLPRSVSNRGWFLVNGMRCPIRGRVCMDQTVIGLPDDTSPDAAVQIAGDPGDNAMSLDDMADIAGTINYEIATRMAARLPRVYVLNGQAVRCELPALAGLSS